MTRGHFIVAALFGSLAVLAVSPGNAQAQLAGLVNGARKAAHRAQAVSAQPRSQARDRNGLVPITTERINAYIRGQRAEQAEAHRLDSTEALSTSTPEMARMAAVMACQSTANEANRESPAQRHADSMMLKHQFATIDTAKMARLARAAQGGDASAMAQLQAMSMQMARHQASDPQVIAMRERMQKQVAASVKATQACESRIPAAAQFAAPIARAKAEIAKYGSRLSQTRNSHLESVKLQAANGMSPTEYAGVDERIRGYMASSGEPAQGFTAAELQLLRANRAQLSTLSY
jgi:hypothetical protein